MSGKSDDCIRGNHYDCDGCNLDSPSGCTCDCHFEEEPKLPDPDLVAALKSHGKPKKRADAASKGEAK